MSTRNFDSRVITDRLQACQHARYVHTTQLAGKAPVSNPQTSNADASTLALFQTGSPSVYQKGLLGGVTTSQSGGTC
jgi:hypothetical protein